MESVNVEKYFISKGDNKKIGEFLVSENQEFEIKIKNKEDINNSNEKAIKKYRGDLQRYNFLRKRNDFETHCKDLGGFIHMIYFKDEILFKNMKIDKNNISRIIFLATYMDYTKKGLLVNPQKRDEKGQYSGKDPLSRAEIQELLGLSDTPFKSFLKNMKDNNLMFVADKKYYINPEYFINGKVGKIDTNKGYCRLYIDTIRQLYNGCPPKQHKVLANIFQLIPFIHYDRNIICKNPNCNADIEEIEYLTLNDICDLLGTSTNLGFRSSLAKQLYSFKINIEDKDFHLLSYVCINNSVDYFVVNPLVIYRGNDLNEVTRLSRTMFFNSQTHRQKRKLLNDSTEINVDEKILDKPLLKSEREELAKKYDKKWTEFSILLKKNGYKVQLIKENKTTIITKK